MHLNRTFIQSSSKAAAGGFSLIETIITLVVISIAAVGVMSVFSVGMGGSSSPLLLSQATQLAQGEMDQVLGEKAASGFASIATGTGLPCVSNMLAGFTCSRSAYYVNAGALNTPAGVATDYLHVTVTITQPTVNSVSLDTVIAKYNN
ncbi:MAG TPA: type II secretion system protein [Nitrospirota bacterium]|nr:type II secretion system protein [Nitrospirota bacterium]